MTQSCTAAPKHEQKWGIKNCREKKCEELKRDPKWPDSAERCMVFNTMPGTLPCCIKDPEMKPETFLRNATYSLLLDWEKRDTNIKYPGPKNCPATCPYKILVDGEKFTVVEGKGVKKPAKITTCAFSGEALIGGSGHCYCHVLGNLDQEAQINTLKCVIAAGYGNNTCWYGTCPDGIERCEVDDKICPVNRLPRMEHGCPLWRIPAKTLPAIAAVEPGKSAPKKPQDCRTPMQKAAVAARILREPKQGPRPSLNRCPDPCPYKMTVLEDHGKEKNYPQGRCAFTGQKLREMQRCPCGVLEEMDERTREYCLKQIRDALQAHAEESFSVKLCHDHKCPDGIVHCCIGDDKQAWVCDAEEGHPPLASLHRCYLARFIPVKTDPIVEKKVPISTLQQPKTDTKVEKPSRKTAQKKKPKLSEYRCDICPIWEYDDAGACKEYLSFPVDERPVVFKVIEVCGCGHHPTLLKLLLKIHEKNLHREVIREAGTRQKQLTEFEDADIGPCKDCSIECPSETDGCEEFQQYVEKECSEPGDPPPDVRPVEVFAECLDCQALDKCKNHDPHAGCMRELSETIAPGYPTSIGGPICKSCGWPGVPTPGRRSCVTCGHHKGRRTFAETCPRKGELMFNGGEKSASRLMAETLAEGCRDAIPKQDPRCAECTLVDTCQTHDPEKQNCVAKAQKKPATRKKKEPESHDPLRKFLNVHSEQIITGKDLPIVPGVLHLYDEMNRERSVPVRLFIAAESPPGRWNWFALHPSGKLRKVKGPTGGHHQGSAYPDCAFHFEWHYNDKKKED